MREDSVMLAFMESIDSRLQNIEKELRASTKDNGIFRQECMEQVSDNTVRIDKLEGKKEWNLKIYVLAVGLAGLFGGLLGNIPKAITALKTILK